MGGIVQIYGARDFGGKPLELHLDQCVEDQVHLLRETRLHDKVSSIRWSDVPAKAAVVIYENIDGSGRKYRINTKDGSDNDTSKKNFDGCASAWCWYRSYFKKFDGVFNVELKRISEIREEKRKRYNAKPVDSLAGLALSGGGIRSAAFSLGVLQVFAKYDLLRKFDYLSTVSGGGYAGTALTWLLSRPTHGCGGDKHRAGHDIGTGVKDHPLGSSKVGAKTGHDNDFIDYISGFGNYLRPTRKLWVGSAAAIIMRIMTKNIYMWLVPLMAILLVCDLVFKTLHCSWNPSANTQAMICAWSAELGEIVCQNPATMSTCVWRYELGNHLQWFWWLALVLLAILIRPGSRVHFHPIFRPSEFVANLPEHERKDALKRKTRDYLERLAEQSGAGKLALLACLALAVASAASIVEAKAWVVPFAGALGASAVLAKASGGIKALARLLPRTVLIEAGAGLLLIFALGAAVAGPEWLAVLLTFVFFEDVPGLAVPEARILVVGIVAVLTLYFAWLSCRSWPNYESLHRLYRDRLMETFMPDWRPSSESDPGIGEWHPAYDAETFPLANACRDKGYVGPYQIVNTNIILISSENSVVRNRGGESFFLSPLYSGCDRTGWHWTETLLGDNPGPAGQDQFLRLSTAMAVSGAAFSPNTGPGGRGPTRGAIVSSLLILFGLRLAFWIANPRVRSGEAEAEDQGKISRIANIRKSAASKAIDIIDWVKGARHRWRPCFAYPGLAALLGRTHRENGHFVELSDGGHFENLGVYELVRRRVPIIVVADAGCDRCFAFQDLANAIERVQVDFGVDIDFSWPAAHVDAVKPGSADAYRIGNVQTDVAQRGWAIAKIEYPKAPPGGYDAALNSPGETQSKPAPEGQPVPVDYGKFEGCLVYLKPALRARLPVDVLGYRAAHREFPHETTADQFFDEAQFEAYRELGYHTGRDFLNSCYFELADAILETSGARPEDMPRVFREAAELLRPATPPKGPRTED